MMARALSATPWGIDARAVQVEVDIRFGLPQMHMVGLPDTAVRESKERVRTAIKNCGFDLPPRVVVVNLAPANIRKEGNYLDLAIALAVLQAHGELPEGCLEDRLFCGELGLDGRIRSVRGGLSIAALGGLVEAREVLLPAPNAAEAAALEVVPVYGLAGLAEAIEHLVGVNALIPTTPSEPPSPASSYPLDLADVRGQEAAKRALEIAAAGGHNALFMGPPGAGKTMLARRLPGILPSLTRAESIAVTKVHSLAAEEPPAGLIRRRPFRSPHPGISSVAMVGGGGVPRPGEVSLAHNGVLFLDELPEFQRDALEALRQPLEEGRLTVIRARGRFTFPARFALLASMNPCPCGHLGDLQHECRCTPLQIERYRNRVSGPLLDRIDLHVEVPSVKLEELRGAPGEASGPVAKRVQAARERQRIRFAANNGSPVNAAMTTKLIEEHCGLDTAARRILDAAFERLGLSARAMTRILKVSRTIADLAASDSILSTHVAEAIQYRALDRRLEQ
jgi:magnesium chelatase family protein